MVFIFGYGVATQALLYPVRPFYLNVFKDVIVQPYWQMYGELMLETTEGESYTYATAVAGLLYLG